MADLAGIHQTVGVARRTEEIANRRHALALALSAYFPAVAHG
jgi:hypothetical protein